MVLGPIVGFFGTGFFSGFTIIASEAFPTAVRGTAMGVVYNVGRFLGAGAPYLIGYITEISGIELALSSISIAFLAAAIIAMGLHETNLMPRVSRDHRGAFFCLFSGQATIVVGNLDPRKRTEEVQPWQSNQSQMDTTAFNRI